MGPERVTLVTRTVLVAAAIIVVAVVHGLVAPGKKRTRMLAGTLGGITFGVLIGYPISHWLNTDASAVCAVLGNPRDWGVAWLFARESPRRAN